ncbi:bifunctional glycosyltransferase family 2/GtrA family protein [Candidatus Daviesbacteria bacterium]|nr:bifunctional glycosyltransferase family 2/GtrA family protein [Candidatus Daviesbacteria bacterium]
MKRVSVVLPTYNEQANITQTIEKVLAQQKNLPGWEIDIVVADDIRSSDNTEKIVKTLAKKNRHIHFIKVEPGLGVGLIKGHEFALEKLHPDILAQLDADGQVVPDVIIRLVKAIEEGNNLAIGSRFVAGGKNQLSFIRRLFTYSASLFYRFIVGPWDIKEVTNSARAFTPDLFKRLNFVRLPWREQTFIVQPAFLHETILAGARYKEVPLIFKDRLEGYSKNKVFNYSYDVITYCIDARLHAWGIDIPFFRITRRAKTLVKFGLVGFIGTLVDFLFYKIFINAFYFTPAMSKAFSTEIAIMNNFLLNNYWTFKYRKTKTNIWQKIGIFNIVSLGGLIIGVLIVKFLHLTYGDGSVNVLGRPVAFNNFYFFATIPPVMIWNFLVNHFITWRRQEE